MNPLHIYGVFLRNIILVRRSVPRLFGLFFFVTFELFLWGFVTFWLRDLVGGNSQGDFILLILSGLIFWHLFIRIQQSFSIAFLEEVWSRNIINFFASPITLKEFVSGMALLSIVQGFIAFIYVSILAFLLYNLQIWTLGFYMIPFIINIFIFGWALGLVTIALIIRFGPSADILAFAIPFLMLPFSAVYYPVSILPPFVQTITSFIPTRYMFEGMRMVITEGTFSLQSALLATGLNLIYFTVGFLIFYFTLRYAKKKGLIARFITN
ncbi:ABC transporter permease [Patescibacteria group bacterium]|nr:ABC transporter permease [Patescibacteria group bacterium]